jgi:hypothetical protein
LPEDVEADAVLVTRLLAFEVRSAASAEDRADAAARLFEKTFAVLSPILGVLGVETIFKRSVRRTQPLFPCLEAIEPLSKARTIDPRQVLRACQQGGDANHSSEAATALYARFFALIALLIGEPLATRLILTAWPDIAETRVPTKGAER